MSIAPLTTLAALADRYQTFFIDQFGVLRDDERAFEGANEALLFLKSLGRTVVILSNSGRSGEENAERLARLGFDRAGFDNFVTSGDVAYSLLAREASASTRGTRCLTISSGGDRNLADRLGFESVDDAALADLVIISGSEAEKIPMEIYRERLRPAAERRRPCYCTNPDRHKLAGGATAPGAGSIALLYETLGGKVRWFGKPYPAIYEHALDVAGIKDRDGVVCIGDSLEHDIRGGGGTGLATCLVRTGILSAHNESELKQLADSLDARPDFILPRFRS